MKNEITISDLIFLSEGSENTFMAERLKELRDLIVENTNDSVLGSEIRKLL